MTLMVAVVVEAVASSIVMVAVAVKAVALVVAFAVASKGLGAMAPMGSNDKKGSWWRFRARPCLQREEKKREGRAQNQCLKYLGVWFDTSWGWFTQRAKTETTLKQELQKVS